MPNYSKKTATIYFGTSLRSETIKIPQLNTQPKIQRKYQEINPSYLDAASSWDTTEANYTTTQIGPKPTRKVLDNMVNVESKYFWGNKYQKPCC